MLKPLVIARSEATKQSREVLDVLELNDIASRTGLPRLDFVEARNDTRGVRFDI